jgi:hypothetical protein
MSSSILEDLEYLGKVLILTFMLLSCVVIYNQKYIEGIILITLCCQIFLIWALINQFGISEIFESIKVESNSNNMGWVAYLLILIISLIAALFYLFRAIVIAQQSIINYGVVKSNFYNDIFIAAVIGSITLIIFIVLYFVGKRFFKTGP